MHPKCCTSPPYNPPIDHTVVLGLDTVKWCGKIPLLDMGPALKGQDIVAGVGKTFITNLCNTVASHLNKAIPAKAGWVSAAPNSDTHAIATAQKVYIATINYINLLNDIPNNPPPSSFKLVTGETDDLEQTLTDETPPKSLGVEDLIKAVLLMDYVASPEEPILDTQESPEDIQASTLSS